MARSNVAYAWLDDKAGQDAVLAGLATGLNAFAGEAAATIRQVEAGLEKYTFGGNVHYRDTITHTTWFKGAIISGSNIRTGVGASRAALTAIIYTASFLGHQLEVTGAKPHRIRTGLEKAIGVPKTEGSIRHPGFARRPHFVPGLFATVSRAGKIMHDNNGTR